ncbi:MAG: hypothetical protein MJA29_13445, partial [Candidatus Omnitrophica bacterium]|nr:hypothetical protein [Candidatus Omnitrophota bacterium]
MRYQTNSGNSSILEKGLLGQDIYSNLNTDFNFMKKRMFKCVILSLIINKLFVCLLSLLLLLLFLNYR